MATGPPDLTALFAPLRTGDDEVLGGIMDALYRERRAPAARRMRGETRRHTLQPTALELRFFGGHTDKEVSEILGTNIRAIRRDWTFARTWLRTHLNPAANV